MAQQGPAPQSFRAPRGIPSSSLVVVGAAAHAAKSRAPPGEAAPRSRSLVGGEDCLSAASSAAQTIGTEAKAPEGPRLGAHGFGSFCRNKRTASHGAATPQAPALPFSVIPDLIRDPVSLLLSFVFVPAPSNGASHPLPLGAGRGEGAVPTFPQPLRRI